MHIRCVPNRRNNICLSIEKDKKIGAILFNWKMNDRVFVRFSLNIMPSRDEDTPG